MKGQLATCRNTTLLTAHMHAYAPGHVDSKLLKTLLPTMAPGTRIMWCGLCLITSRRGGSLRSGTHDCYCPSGQMPPHEAFVPVMHMYTGPQGFCSAVEAAVLSLGYPREVAFEFS